MERIMVDIFSINSENLYDNLFVNSSDQQIYLDNLSNQALSTGIDLYSKKDYEGAVKEFQRAINLSPNSYYSVDSTKYLAQSYLKLKKTDKAVEAYQKAIKRQPNDESLRTELGKIFYSEDRFSEAVNAYQAAVNINPNSSSNQYSLGQAQLKVGNYRAAEVAFASVIRLDPQSTHGYVGLGQVYAKEGDYKRAIEKFETAITKQKDNYDDKGDIDEAKEIAEFLDKNDDDLSSLLKAYIEKVEKPKMLYSWPADSTFRYFKTFKTPVAALDSYLENADTSKSMTLKIQFSKNMDRASVENTLNWNISRAQGSGPFQTYNFGEVIPETETAINPLPDFVLYDAKTQTATISFTIKQNSTTDATIDPSHIVFKFSGKDAEGIKMDAKYDEFAGFRKVF
jgi:tetratricopeptide (TPR) repeat protein